MNHSDLIDGIRKNIWATGSAYESVVPTMLSSTELKMLAWLTEHYEFQDHDYVADLGAFLGGSTCALAFGLDQRPDTSKNAGRIHSYDMFRVPADQYSQGLIASSRVVGESVIDLYSENIRTYRNSIIVHEGDITSDRAPERDLAIAFIDVSKSESINAFLVDQFLSQLVPGKSIVIQQDHNDHSCPWVAVTMEYLSDYFEYLADDSSSRVFLNKIRIPASAGKDVMALSPFDKAELLDAAARRSKNPISAYLVLASKAWIVRDMSGTHAALAFLSEIRSQQPWQGDPYVDRVAAGLAYVNDPAGLNSYIRRDLTDARKFA